MQAFPIAPADAKPLFVLVPVALFALGLLVLLAVTLGGARRVGLSREVDLQPAGRTLGTGLPGYQAGWFRLRNGEKALLYLTNRMRSGGHGG
jgi:hypothetical protein